MAAPAGRDLSRGRSGSVPPGLGGSINGGSSHSPTAPLISSGGVSPTFGQGLGPRLSFGGSPGKPPPRARATRTHTPGP